MNNQKPFPRTANVSNPYSSKKETPSLPLGLPKTPRELFLAHLNSSVSQLDKESQVEKPIKDTASSMSNNVDNDVPWAQRLLSSQVPMFAEIRTVSEYQNLQPIQGQFYRLTGKLVHKTVHSPTCISLVLEDPLQATPRRAVSRKRRVSFPLSGQRNVSYRTPSAVKSTPKYLGGKTPTTVIRRNSLLRKTPPLSSKQAATPPPSALENLIEALKERVWVVVRHIPLNDITVGDLIMVLGSTQVINSDRTFTSDKDSDLLREVTRCSERTYYLNARIVRSAVGTDMKLYQQALMARRAYLSQRASGTSNMTETSGNLKLLESSSYQN